MKKELFKKFSEDKDHLPFSLQYNWWNEVVEQEWDVAVVENQGEVKAIWPFTIRKKFGFTLLGPAEITPYCGPYMLYPEGQKLHRKYSFEKKILDELLAQIPSHHFFEQNCHLDFVNTLPLSWKGWKHHSRYTFVLNNITDLKSVYAGFADNIRREIKKAEKELRIVEAKDISNIIYLMESSFSAQSSKLPLPESIFHSFQKYIHHHSCGKIYLAKNFNQQTVAGIAIIWDKSCAYYLLGGADKEFKNSGAMSLLLWKAIQFSSTVVGKFNFEGSRIQKIERFLRGFGGELKPYQYICHSKSPLLDVIKNLKG